VRRRRISTVEPPAPARLNEAQLDDLGTSAIAAIALAMV